MAIVYLYKGMLMDMLTNVERMRLENLKILHAKTPGNGAPTSDFLVKFLKGKGCSVTKTDISNIYWERKAIDTDLARAIEIAFNLPADWMDDAHDFVFSLTAAENLVMNRLLSTPADVKGHLSSLILSISHSRVDQ